MRRFLLCFALLASACAAPADAPVRVAAPPASLGLDPFYAKHVDAGGIPIVGSARVPDEALAAARQVVVEMLAKRRDVRAELVRTGQRVGVMAVEESTTDLPEHRQWRKPAPDDPRLTFCERKTYATAIGALTDREYWDRRARGTGGRFTTVGAENLLGRPGTRYFGENILVHEFAHAILTALETVDPALHAEVRSAYAAALAAGKWKGDYASVTLQEYWAEGTQYWFENNMLARLDEAEVVSAEDLRRYDPRLHAALGKVYGRKHRIAADPFHRHVARLNVPKGYKSADC